MSNDAQNSASEISQYFRDAAQARHAKTPRPPILDEEPPQDPTRLPGWRATRQQTEERYIAELLAKGRLSQEEQAYIGSQLARYRQD